MGLEGFIGWFVNEWKIFLLGEIGFLVIGFVNFFFEGGLFFLSFVVNCFILIELGYFWFFRSFVDIIKCREWNVGDLYIFRVFFFLDYVLWKIFYESEIIDLNKLGKMLFISFVFCRFIVYISKIRIVEFSNEEIFKFYLI